MTAIKLIASDLDGTLLLNGAQDLREDTCELITALKEQGILFAAASGRQLDSLRRLFEPVKDKIYYVCQNGASCYADGKQIADFQVDEETARELVEDIRSRPGYEVFVSQFGISYVESRSEAFIHYLRDIVRLNVEEVESVLPYVKGCSKVSMYEADGRFDTAYWMEHYQGRCTVARSGDQWLEVMPNGVSKQTSLKRLLDYLHLSPEEIIVFGDNMNDLEMMQYAACAATVESAAGPARDCADVIVPTVEDAMRRILSGADQIEDWVRR